MNLASVTGESIKSKTISEYLEQTYRKNPPGIKHTNTQPIGPNNKSKGKQSLSWPATFRGHLFMHTYVNQSN